MVAELSWHSNVSRTAGRSHRALVTSRSRLSSVSFQSRQTGEARATSLTRYSSWSWVTLSPLLTRQTS